MFLQGAGVRGYATQATQGDRAMGALRWRSPACPLPHAVRERLFLPTVKPAMYVAGVGNHSLENKLLPEALRAAAAKRARVVAVCTRLEGKEHIVKDGDGMHLRLNVRGADRARSATPDGTVHHCAHALPARRRRARTTAHPGLPFERDSPVYLRLALDARQHWPWYRHR